MAVFLCLKDVHLWIKLGAIQHKNLFISTIQPITKVAVLSVTNSLNYGISQINI